MPRFLIKNGILITQNPDREICHKDILIENGIISKIEEHLYIESESLDATGKYIIPGFIQPHLYLSLPGIQKSNEIKSSTDLLKIISEQTSESVRQTAKDNCALLLEGGTTTLLGMEHPLYTEEVFHVVQRSGLRAAIGNSWIDHGDAFSKIQMTMEKLIIQSEKLFRKWHQSENSRIRYLLCPWSIPLCSGQAWREIADISNRQNILIHTHACETSEEVRSVRHGRSSETIHYFDQFDLADDKLSLAHGIWLTGNELKIIKQGQVNIIHCPSANQFLEVGIAPVPEMLKLGINVALSTTGLFCNPSLDMFSEMRNVSSMHGNQIDFQTILDMATVHGAKAIGLENEIGSIETGNKADLVILDLNTEFENPIENLIRKGTRELVKAVIIDGNIILNK